MKNLTIIGKNSRLYKIIKPQISEFINNEFSFKEIDSIKGIENAIVFSFDHNSFQSNIELLEKIYSKVTGRLIYVSSTSVYAMHYCQSYQYANIKKRIENYLVQKTNTTILRIGIVEEFISKDWYHGKIKLSSQEKIVGGIKESLQNDYRVLELWEEIIVNNVDFKKRFFYGFLVLTSKYFKRLFFITRPFDLLFRFLGYKNYGYTFLSNQFDPKYTHIIVGAGMGALGVVEALKTKNLVNDVLLIHDYFSNKHHSEKGHHKPLETIGRGGNSSKWHGVISNYNYNIKAYKKSYQFFLKKYYKIEDGLKYLDQYSFVPFAPIRPLKFIKSILKKDKIVEDKILIIEEKQNHAIIHTTKASYRTKKLHLCSGTFSTLKILFDSHLIKQNKFTLSEHLVGYFGQFESNKTAVVSRFTSSGHYKRFHNIELKNRSCYLTFRPANFKFQNLKYADLNRDFFSNKKSTIIFSLIKRMNLGLISEAIFNKFGIAININNCYNIVGHIQSKNTVSVKLTKSEDPSIVYNEKSIDFDDEEITSMKNYIINYTEARKIMIRKNSAASPGLHYLEISDKTQFTSLPKCIQCYSTIFFNDYSPKHPTFHLLIDSYERNTI